MATLYESRESFDDWSVNLEGSGVGQYAVPGDENSSAAFFAANSSSEVTVNLIDNIPPQLHPAVSMGMRRVSSCYFSVHSEGSNNNRNSLVDLLSLLENEEDQKAQ